MSGKNDSVLCCELSHNADTEMNEKTVGMRPSNVIITKMAY